MISKQPPQLERLLQFPAPCMDSRHPDQRIQRDEIRLDVARFADGLLEVI